MVELNVPLATIQLFVLVFARITAVVFMLPVFNSKSVPILFKAGFCVAVSIVLVPLLKLDIPFMHREIIPFVIGLIGEVFLGVLIGFAVDLLFRGFQMAGQIAGFQMGFTLANVVDPLTSIQGSLIGQFHQLLALVLFLVTNSHRLFIRALAESFHMIPPLGVHMNGSLFQYLVKLSGDMFVIALMMGAPLITALLLATIALGLIARTVPQMNVFFVAIPVNITIGLVFIFLSLPFLVQFMEKMFPLLYRQMLTVISGMR